MTIDEKITRNGCRLAILSLAVLSLLAPWSVAFGQSPSLDKQSQPKERVYTDPTWDKRPQYRKSDYTELTGADAARFLIGNSVIFPAEDEGQAGVSPKQIYYFADAHTVYQCSPALEGQCGVGTWSVGDKGICFEIGACSETFAVYRSPQWQDWERNYGKLGFYLTYNHYEAEIVKGNWTGGPSFTTNVSASHIELNRADYAGEIANSAQQLHFPDDQVIIRGQRALSLLIGNTFLSRKTEADLKEKSNDFCPQEGEFYSPDGLIVQFDCFSGNIWDIGTTRWRNVAGMLCRDGFDALEEFGCEEAIVTAVPDPSDPGKMRVIDWNGAFTAIQDSPIGYSGNIFNFRFGQGDK